MENHNHARRSRLSSIFVVACNGEAARAARYHRRLAAQVGVLAAEVPSLECVCYQMDLYQAKRVEESLAERQLHARVVTAPDLWDLPERFATLLYPVPAKGERSLKLDMIEQAFHAWPKAAL